MQSLIVSLHPELDEVGGCKTIAGRSDESSYDVGPDTYPLVDGVDYDIVLTNTGEAVLASGIARATACAGCSRCLAPVEFDIAGEVEGYYLMQDDTRPADGRDDDEFGFVLPDDTIDLSDALLAALVIETPVVSLCEENCAGLCPRCGKNLNDGPCGCAPEERQDGRVNPFAVLKNLDLGEEGADLGSR
jgi:uncharacterized protein